MSVGFVTGALILLAVALYLSSHYLTEQLRLAETGDLRGARAEVERAALLDPFSPEPVSAEAYLQLRQGQTEAAAQTFREAIRREPINYKNYVDLGDLQRQRLSDPQAAAASYREALERNPNATVVVARLGETLLSIDDREGAKAQYEWLRERGKIPLRGLYTLGQIQLRLDEPEEAIETFQEAKEGAGVELGASDESEEDLMESLDIAIADALVVQGLYDEAREALSRSSSGQAPAVLALLDENPEAYRESVLHAPIS